MVRKWTFWVVVAAAVGWAGLAIAQEVARPEYQHADLPVIWKAVKPADRLGAVRAAEVDATRLLAERIYGLRINADTWVLDLAMASDEIRTGLDTMIRGVRLKEVKYIDDLSVEVVKEVTVREVVETLTRNVTRTQVGSWVHEVKVENIYQIANRDMVLAVMGNAAIAGSEGQKKIMAKRAAEIDCYRRIAERVLGIRINANTTVRDFVLEKDQILTHVAGCLKGVKFTKIVYRNDGTCEVTGQLKLRDVVETMHRTYNRYVVGGKVTENEWKNVSTTYRDTVIEETGAGAQRDETFVAGTAAAMTQPYYTQKTVIERIIRREVGAE